MIIISLLFFFNQSAEALNLVKHDLSEFVSTIQHDTSAVVADTATAVKESLKVMYSIQTAKVERFDWCIERIQTHLAFGWLSERLGKQTSCPKNFLEIPLTSYCNTIGQSSNVFSILGFSLAGKRRVHVFFFPSIG